MVCSTRRRLSAARCKRRTPLLTWAHGRAIVIAESILAQLSMWCFASGSAEPWCQLRAYTCCVACT
jgi:hypothetical protein